MSRFEQGIIVAIVLVILLTVSVLVVRSEECGLIYTWPEHGLCGGGSRSLHICVEGDNSYFMTTCLGIPVVETEECDTMLCGWCQEYPELCDLYATPYPMPELRHEYLPMIANASLPTPAPTQNPFPTITYPPPVTPVP